MKGAKRDYVEQWYNGIVIFEILDTECICKVGDENVIKGSLGVKQYAQSHKDSDFTSLVVVLVMMLLWWNRLSLSLSDKLVKLASLIMSNVCVTEYIQQLQCGKRLWFQVYRVIFLRDRIYFYWINNWKSFSTFLYNISIIC